MPLKAKGEIYMISEMYLIVVSSMEVWFIDVDTMFNFTMIKWVGARWWKNENT